jgi:hypothetical protein
VPAIALADGFVPGESHGFPEFIAGCDAVVMAAARSCPRSARVRGRGRACRCTC